MYIEDDNLHLQTTHKLMNELSMLLRSDEVKPCLEHVNSLLTIAILKCRIAIENADKSTSQPQPFSNKENVAPTKNLTTSGNSKSYWFTRQEVNKLR